MMDYWKDDTCLHSILQNLVKQNLKRSEILNYVEKDFSQYNWSLRTLARRLQFFGISYSDPKIKVESVKKAIAYDLKHGTGKDLGYRSMHKKVRNQYGLHVPRHLVYAVLSDLDPEGLKQRQPGPKKAHPKGYFTSKGPNWVHSLDGHCKLMGFQRNTFPLAVYGSIDTASRRLLWLKVWTDNSNPMLIARWYFQYLYDTRLAPSMIRLDKGTETGKMATMHCYLRSLQGVKDPSSTVIFGQSTSNQIERWWRELHEKLENCFKPYLMKLKRDGLYNPSISLDRQILAYIFIPVLQKEMETFVENWNFHRIRRQRNTCLPDGIPDHIYRFPNNYNMEECGHEVSCEVLKELAEVSGVLHVEDDYLNGQTRAEFEAIINREMCLSECVGAYTYLKNILSARH